MKWFPRFQHRSPGLMHVLPLAHSSLAPYKASSAAWPAFDCAGDREWQEHEPPDLLRSPRRKIILDHFLPAYPFLLQQPECIEGVRGPGLPSIRCAVPSSDL